MIKEQWAKPEELKMKKDKINIYMSQLKDSEKNLCEKAFNNALNLGVSTFEFGHSLIEETIYNLVLNKINFRYTTLPITAMATIKDRDIYIVANPYYLCTLLKHTKNDLNEQNLTIFYRAVIKHELLHVMLKHLIRDSKRNNLLIVNLATDALINREIHEFKYLNIPRITPEEILFEGKKINGAILFPSVKGSYFTWEEYYDYILQTLQNQKQKIDNNSQTMENSLESDSKNITLGDINPLSPDQINDVLKDKINHISEEVQHRLRGTGKIELFQQLSFKSEIKRANKWKSILRQAFRGNTILYRHYSMKRRNKRTNLPPGKKYTYKGGLVYFFIDISASVDNKDLEIFAKELQAVVRKFNYKYKAFTFTDGLGKEIDLRQIRKGEFKIENRGGTSIKNALEELKNKKLPIPDIYVVFTDGYDDVPTPDEFNYKMVIYAFSYFFREYSQRKAQEYGYTTLVLDKNN